MRAWDERAGAGAAAEGAFALVENIIIDGGRELGGDVTIVEPGLDADELPALLFMLAMLGLLRLAVGDGGPELLPDLPSSARSPSSRSKARSLPFKLGARGDCGAAPCGLLALLTLLPPMLFLRPC